MIYTVTLNPALDRAVTVDRLLEDDTTRVQAEKHYAAGKGIDVSRVITELGGKSVALGLVGGYDGLQLEGLLINAGVMTSFKRISGETRTNIILREASRNRQYVISAAGPEVGSAEIAEFYRGIVEIQDMEYLVMSGSLARGVSHNLYGQLILAARKKNAFSLLDADGRAMQESIGFQPTCIKPNIHELSRLVGRELETESDILDACERIHREGVTYVLVSRGKDGLILSTETWRLKAKAPAVETESAVGAGDSAVAGFVLGHSRGGDLTDCLRLSCAAGAATAMTPGTELCHRETVEALLPRIELEEI
ncbi:MAG: 1-phosphofructokinase [Deltaproteobacteria bacterium]|nr:1-phosphofructokinase [Deltaproteobacteria bacterium]